MITASPPITIINESPMMDQTTSSTMEKTIRSFTPRTLAKVDELVDWLIEKNKSGYKMVNSVSAFRT